MAVFNREQLIQAAKQSFKTKEVEIGDGKVKISELPAGEFIDFTNALRDEKGNVDLGKFTFGLVTRCIVDEECKRIFNNDEVELIKTIFSKDHLASLGDAVKELNGITGEEKNDSEPTKDGETSGELQLPLDIDTPTT